MIQLTCDDLAMVQVTILDDYDNGYHNDDDGLGYHIMTWGWLSHNHRHIMKQLMIMTMVYDETVDNQ